MSLKIIESQSTSSVCVRVPPSSILKRILKLAGWVFIPATVFPLGVQRDRYPKATEAKDCMQDSRMRLEDSHATPNIQQSPREVTANPRVLPQ